ncbi:ABC transporter substrate-binding protein [Alkalicoccobacillus murimartini]|uniref:Multiple sugar transport system substrate-binding protein n=1 Tax=Alkalicoccobacillus murimartini TaxID=171685 RepID=A0ABT9YIK2_9BACI|nr:sugar ABC transporter substrate-binding protein [Alkalicoccobacillus murimartini]MDQ0207679.1 multiple sugar transport system substrate-binding protein [Alkalicoccobacillus murimartini]
MGVKKRTMVVIVACGILAGCSSSDTSSEEDVVKLDFLTYADPAQLKVYQRAVDAFHELHGDEIQVELTGLPADNYTQTLTTRLQGSEGPDIYYVQDFSMSTFVQGGTALPLDDFLEGPDSYVRKDEFPDDIWGPTQKDGVTYALVPDANPFVMYYNKSVFEEVGVKSPQEYYDEGNWSWDTLKEITSTFKEAGKEGYVQDGGPFGVNTWIYSNGGSVEKDGEVVIDSDPKTIEAIEYVNQMVQDGNFVFSGSLPQGQGRDAMFMSDQVALVGAGRWLTPLFLESNKDFDYIPWPTNTGEQMEPTLVTSAYLAVNSDTDYPEEAMKFISYYVSEEGQEIRLADNGNSVPSIAGLEHVVTDNPEPEHAEYLLDAIRIGQPIVFEFETPGLSNEMRDIYEIMFIGDITAEEAISRLGDKAREMTEE